MNKNENLVQRLTDAVMPLFWVSEESEAECRRKLADALRAHLPAPDGEAVIPDDHNYRIRHEKWREMVAGAKAAVEGFNDMPDDKAILHADSLIRGLEQDVLQLRHERDAYLRAAASNAHPAPAPSVPAGGVPVSEPQTMYCPICNGDFPACLSCSNCHGVGMVSHSPAAPTAASNEGEEA